MNFSERLKALRKELGLTQEEMGKRIGLSKFAVSKIENGENGTPDRTVKLICTEFKVNYLWLTEGIGPVFSDYEGAILDELTENFHLDETDREIVRAFLEMSDEDRKTIKQMIHYIRTHP